uniref:Uncharacterized protein n=1 Tax=Arundo donax TaxID=35708 RepID=A0A0A9A974_ARUDO
MNGIGNNNNQSIVQFQCVNIKGLFGRAFLKVILCENLIL